MILSHKKLWVRAAGAVPALLLFALVWGVVFAFAGEAALHPELLPLAEFLASAGRGIVR